MIYLTSLTIGGMEWISKLRYEGTEYGTELGGNIATATFVVQDEAANINGITGRPEVIAYIGSTKVWGGYAAVYSKELVAPETGILRLTIQCQGYAVLMDRAVVTAEHVFTGTDEAALDTLFSTYCSAISTTPVNQVIADLKGLTIKVGTSIRKAAEMIAERSGAEMYVTPDKALEYFDPASDAPAAPFWLREPDAVTTLFDGEPSTGGWTAGSTGTYTASAQTVIEDSDTSEHYLTTSSIGSTVIGERYVFAVDVKQNGRTWIALGSQSDSYNKTYFDIANIALGTKAATHSAQIVPLGDGWVRCIVGFEATSTGGAVVCYMGTANGTVNYAGDGSSGIYIRNAYVKTGHTFLAEGFSHRIDNATLANDVTVRAGADGTETVDIYCEGGPSDGHVYKQDNFNWPPTGSATPDDSADPMYLRVGHTGSTYYIQLPMFKFDTSAIPSDATITAAELHLRVTGTPVAASGNGIGIEYYAASNWSIDASDWTSTPAQDAYAYANPTINALADNVFALLNPDSNINKSGETGLRMHYSFTGTPASDYIEMSIQAVDGAAGQGPFLRVTYTAPAVQANDTDATSISAYGTQKITLVDTSIQSDAEAALVVAVQLAQRKDPLEYGSLETLADGLSIGDLVHIESSSNDIDDDFLIRAIRTSWPDGRCTYAIEYGDWRPDQIRLMRQLAALKES